MNSMKQIVRTIAALVAALALLGFSAGATVAQDAEPVTVRIHKATCPDTTGVDIFEQCHDNALPDINFVITSDFEVVEAGVEIATVTTGDNGRASRQVPAGAITITEDEADFAEFVGARVFCSVQGTNEVLFDDRAEDDGSVTFDAEAGQEVICDWYDLTGDAVATATPTTEPTVDPGDELATVRIHKASCPANTQGDIFEACHENALADITFDINGDLVTTGDNGRASRSVLPGEIVITEDVTDAANYTGARVVCTEQASQDVLVDESTDTQSVAFEAAAGDLVVCDWYNLEGGSDDPTATADGNATATSPAATATTDGGGGTQATATSEAGSATDLPSTGAGTPGGSSNALLLVVALLLSVVGGAFIFRKQQPT